MREILHKLLLFLSPFMVISLFTLMVDPYNLFNISTIVSDEIKIECLDRNNNVTIRAYATWRTLNFLSDPTPNIILGDSRIAYISDTLFEEKLGGKVSNLAIPLGNIKTIIELFWMAASSTELENIIVQINFNRYNHAVNDDLLLPVRQLIEKPYSYFFNAKYVKDSFAVFFSSLKKNNQFANRMKPQIVDDWKFSEQSIIRNFKYPGYIYPQNYYDELKKISTFCLNEDINLLFVITPNYYDVHQYIESFNLENEYERFKTDLRSLGTTIDLDDGLPISYDDDMYADHFHFQPHLADTLISLIYP